MSEDVPQLASLTAAVTRSAGDGRSVPLITNVMGSSAAEFAQLVEAARPPRIHSRRAERVLPEREDGLDIGADPRSSRMSCARSAAGARSPDREAHPQHRRRGGVRAGRPGRWSRRGFADQHAASDGSRAARAHGSASALVGAAPAGCPEERSHDRPGAGRRGRRPPSDPRHWPWAAFRAQPTRGSDRCRATLVASAPRASAIRRPPGSRARIAGGERRLKSGTSLPKTESAPPP